jgi:hypothetical protein
MCGYGRGLVPQLPAVTDTRWSVSFSYVNELDSCHFISRIFLDRLRKSQDSRWLGRVSNPAAARHCAVVPAAPGPGPWFKWTHLSFRLSFCPTSVSLSLSLPATRTNHCFGTVICVSAALTRLAILFLSSAGVSHAACRSRWLSRCSCQLLLLFVILVASDMTEKTA